MPEPLLQIPALEHSTSLCAVSVAYALSAHATPVAQVPVEYFRSRKRQHVTMTRNTVV